MQSTEGGAKRAALLGLLCALALVLGFVESLLPLFPALPGVKLGLSNCVLLFALYALGRRAAFLLLLLKVTLSSLLFAGPSAFFYSLAGGLCALSVMALLHMALPKLALPFVSVAGALMHGLGQLAVAGFVLGMGPVRAYAPWLLGFSVPAGIVTGLGAGAGPAADKDTDEGRGEGA